MLKTSLKLDGSQLILIRLCLTRALADGQIGYLEIEDSICVLNEIDKACNRLIKAKQALIESNEPETPLDNTEV